MVSSRELYSLGLSRAQTAGRVRSGSLHRIHRGVYAVGHQRLTLEGRLLAATLIAAGAVLSHLSAAALWRIGAEPRSSEEIHVTLPGEGGRKRRRGLVVHRTSEPIEAASRSGITVTTVARTILDCAAMVPRRRLERMLDEAERLRRCRSADLRAVLDAHPHRPGTGRLAAALAAHDPGATRTRSELEERFLTLCDGAGLPRPLVNHPVLGFEADFLWPAHRLIAETDGAGTHLTRRGFQTDRSRDAALATAGYQVLRFTWRDVAERPRLVAGQLAAVLRLRG